MEINRDLYANYNHKRYAHYRNIKTGEFEREKVKSAKTGERLKPIMKKVQVSFDEVKELKLDTVGTVAPNLDTEDFTIISNYLVDFWGAIMGDSVVSAYLHLKRHAYGKKDFCYIDIDLIALKMGKSKNAVKGYLDTLEEYGFIAIFLRKDTEDRNRDVSPLFKIRRYVPLITAEMYNSLHPKMQKLHDEFMEQFEDINLSTSLSPTTEIIEEIVSEGEVINNKAVQEKIETAIKEGQITEYILHKFSLEQREENDVLHEALKSKLSKPSYDTWIKHSVFLKQDDLKMKVLSPNSFTRDWVDGRYSPLIKEVAKDAISFSEIGDIEVLEMTDYINRIKSRVG